MSSYGKFSGKLCHCNSMFLKMMGKEAAARASFQIVQVIAKAETLFTVGVLIKSCFIQSV
jgi:hypothetical protein